MQKLHTKHFLQARFIKITLRTFYIRSQFSGLALSPAVDAQAKNLGCQKG